MPDEIELVSVQYPGRHDRFDEPCARTMGQLVDGILAEIDSLLDRPVAFFGHSMGATVAFETAVALQSTGRAQVPRLVASSRTAPSRARPMAVDPRDEQDLLSHLRRLGSAGSESLERQPRLKKLVLRPLRADIEILNAYRHTASPPLRHPITAIVGDNDASCPRADVDAWREHTTAGFDMHVLPGGHFYLERSLPQLTALLHQLL